MSVFKKNALYIGSFDMFTNGHLDVIEQVIDLFDTIHITIAKNAMKKRRYTADSMRDTLVKLFADKPYHDKIMIHTTTGLAIRFAERRNCEYIIRGIRNNTDYNFEESLSQANASVNSNIKTIYVRTRYPHISSTFVEDMYTHDEDVSKYLPYDINKLVRSQGE